MTDRELDTMMQRVLFDALQEDWSTAIETVPPTVTSAKYQRWERAMNADPFGWCRRKTRPLWKKCMRNIAAVLLIVLLSFTALMAASPTARATVVKWVEVQWENYTEYFFAGPSPEKGSLPEYSLTCIEDGYELVDEDPLFAGMKNVYYENEEGTPLLFGYMEMSSGNGCRVDMENMTVSDVTVNGCEGQFFLSHDPEVSNYLVWMDADNNIQFYLDGYIDRSGLLRMASSVKISK